MFLALPRRRQPGEAPFDSVHARVLAETAKELEVMLLELGDLGLGSTGPNDAYFIDTLHLSPAGHRYLAERLARELRARGVL